MTTLPEEAVKAAMIAQENAFIGGYDPDIQMKAALTAALPFLSVQGAVKKLEWVKHPNGLHESAKDAFGGLYLASEGGWRQMHSRWNDISGLEAAKAAAQADYSARILSALEPSAASKLTLEEAAKIAFDISENGEYHGEASVDSASSIYQQGAFEVYEAIRALSSPDHADAGKVEGVGWRPISSAPKDGTVIDLWSDEYGRLTDCYWGAPMAYEGGETGWVHAHSNEWAESPDEFVCWRPIPTPPSSEVA